MLHIISKWNGDVDPTFFSGLPSQSAKCGVLIFLLLVWTICQTNSWIGGDLIWDIRKLMWRHCNALKACIGITCRCTEDSSVILLITDMNKLFITQLFFPEDTPKTHRILPVMAKYGVFCEIKFCSDYGDALLMRLKCCDLDKFTRWGIRSTSA